jgi:hypothetical protein
MSPHVIHKLRIPEEDSEDGDNNEVEIQNDDDNNGDSVLPGVLTSVRSDYNV